jgi:DNA-binding transcriptional LysR family regulator
MIMDACILAAQCGRAGIVPADWCVMELRHLECFVAVAEEGHFTQAANRCHVSQSALSTSIHSLERELGSPLFVRTTRRVELTEAGRVLLGEARRTLAAAASARDSVLAVQGLLRGSLQVGGVPTRGLLDQAALLAGFRDCYPAVDIRYVRDASVTLIPQVAASRLDVAFVSLPRQLPEPLLAIPLITQPLLFVCRPDHPLAGRKRVALTSLVDEPLIGLPPKGSAGYEALDRVFADAGKRPQGPFELNDAFSILDFVGHGFGVALVVGSVAASRPDLRAIPLAGPAMTWTLAAIAHRHHATPAARAFIALLDAPEVSDADGGLTSGPIRCGRRSCAAAVSFDRPQPPNAGRQHWLCNPRRFHAAQDQGDAGHDQRTAGAKPECQLSGGAMTR